MSELPDDESSEQDVPTMETSSEMEEALREATEAVDAHRAPSEPEPVEPVSSADKLTIELLSQELQGLKSLHEEKIKEFEEQSEQFLRLQAEFENFRRRGLKEKQESLRYGHQNLVKDLLSAVDNLERALEHGAQNAGTEVGEGILGGIELVHHEILGALAKHGVKEVEAEGTVFDPASHEAMGQVPTSEVPPNTVLQVLQKGYLIHDRMLRPARVMISREASSDEAEPGDSE